MKNTFITGFIGLALFAGPLAAGAQSYSSYYPGTVTYPNTGYVLGASCVALTRYLTLSSNDAYTGGQVTILQQFLNTAGYLRGISGYFDQGTYGAVINYQREHGIYPTGTVGPMTRASMNQQSCSGVYPGSGSVYPIQNNGISISSLSVTSGYPGMAVTLYGTNLNAYNTSVHFGNTTVPVNSSSNNTISFIVPSYGLGTYQVYVTNNFGTSNSLSFTVSGQNNTNGNTCYWSGNVYQCGCNTYNNSSYNSNYNNCSNNNYPTSNTWFGTDNQPRISGVSGPGTASTGNTNTWSVQAYSVTGQSYTVRVDWGDGTSQQSSQSYGTGQQSYPFTHTYSNSGSYTIRFTATDANGTFSYSTLPVSVYGGYSNNNANYNGYGTPVISYVSATTASRGSTVVINGSNFTPNDTVYLGGSSYSVSSYNNGSAISFTIPTYISPGSYSISVMNGNGQTSNSIGFQVQW